MENECEESSEEESIFSYFIEVDLKDYSQSMANNLEDSPYAYLPTKDGNNQRVVQKSAIVLFAEAGVRRLGNDRISRVIQTATLPERKKQVGKEVGKQIVHVGDWWLFKNVEEDNYYLGKQQKQKL